MGDTSKVFPDFAPASGILLRQQHTWTASMYISAAAVEKARTAINNLFTNMYTPACDKEVFLLFSSFLLRGFGICKYVYVLYMCDVFVYKKSYRKMYQTI